MRKYGTFWAHKLSQRLGPGVSDSLLRCDKREDRQHVQRKHNFSVKLHIISLYNKNIIMITWNTFSSIIKSKVKVVTLHLSEVENHLCKHAWILKRRKIQY